jgi:homoserine kinase
LGVIAFTQRPDLLTEALKDRVHQDERLALLPAVKSVFDELTSQGVPVCVSGAGPSLLAFEQEGKSVPDPGDGWRVLPLEPDLTGARIV